MEFDRIKPGNLIYSVERNLVYVVQETNDYEILLRRQKDDCWKVNREYYDSNKDKFQRIPNTNFNDEQ